MEIRLLTISKQCSAIINCCNIDLPVCYPITRELYDRIYDLYPTLDRTQYNLYWRYSKDTFYQISDYLSYITVLTLMFDRTMYLVVDDCDVHCEENEGFLRKLDRIELAEARERARDLYDVIIVRKGQEPEPEDDSDDDILEELRTDSQIISYAIRKLVVPKYFTSDLIFKANLVRDVIKGWPKLKNKLTPLNEEVIERASENKKDAKGNSDKDKKKK